jgi:hypothetical protein
MLQSVIKRAPCIECARKKWNKHKIATCSQHWGPPIHNMGPCRPGEDLTGNNLGLSQTRAINPRYRPTGQRGILDEGLRGGGPGGRPFGARRSSLSPAGAWLDRVLVR